MSPLRNCNVLKALFLAGSLSCGLQFWQVAQAQLTIQSNPVFSTPTPAEQTLGPQPKPPFESVIEFNADTPSEEEGASLPPVQETKPPEEIRLGEIDLEGNKYFHSWVIKHHLKPIRQKQGELMSVKALEAELKRINAQNTFKLKAFLTQKPGGVADLRVDVYERQPFQITGTFDNQGRPGLGTYRGSAAITDENLLGIGDKAFVQYVGAERDHLIIVGYNLPLNRRGGNFDVKFRRHWLDYDTALTGGADLEGTDHAWILTLEQPIDKRRRFIPYVSTLFRHVTIDVNDIRVVKADPRPWTVGMKMNFSDRLGDTKIDLAPLIVGQNWFGGDSKFYRGYANLNRTLKLPAKNLVILRGAWQWTGDELPPVQQFQIGGEYTVRGYSEGVITADRGHFYSLEYHWPVPFLKTLNPWLSERVRGVAFMDFGQSWLDRSNARFVRGRSVKTSRTTLFSLGMGLRYRLTQYAQGFMDVGYGVFNRGLIELGSDPTFRVHFGIRSDFLPKNYKKRGDQTLALKSLKHKASEH